MDGCVHHTDTSQAAGSKGAISVILLIIACASLFLDHIATVFDIQGTTSVGISVYDLLRAIGRFAFPLMAFFIAEWCYKAKNLNKFIVMLFVSAVITELITRAVFNNWSIYPSSSIAAIKSISILSITNSSMFTFLYGALAIWGYEKLLKGNHHAVVKYLPAIAFGLLAQVMGSSFYGLGVLLIFILYVIRKTYPDMQDMKERNKADLYRGATFIIFLIPLYAFRGLWLLPFAIFGMLFTFAYDGVLRKNLDIAFLIFYPLHYVVLYAATLII